VAPKTKTFSATMSLADRILFVIISDSIGYDAGISRILSKLAGDEAPTIPSALQSWMQKMDADICRRKAHREKIETKKKRAAKSRDKIKECIADDKKARIRGLDYGSGIALQKEQAAEATATTASASSLAKPMALTNKVVVCNRCGESGHARSTNKKCKFYKPPKKRDQLGHIKNLSVSAPASTNSEVSKNST